MNAALPPDLHEKLRTYPDKYLAGHSIDCVVLGFRERRLQVLLLKWKIAGVWCLPGGFIEKQETLEESARRVLEKRTGLDEVLLRQFHTFSDPARRHNPEQETKLELAFSTMPKEIREWLSQRFISTGFYALVDASSFTPRPDEFSDFCEWKPVDDLPETILDHANIIERALKQIRVEMKYLPMGGAMLREPFTMVELRELYEALLGEELDRGNFQRKMLRLNHLIRTEEKKMNGGAHRAPYLYRFNWSRYEELFNNGIGYL